MSGAMNHGVFPWTEEAIAFLRKSRGEGLSCSYIANQLSAKYQHPLSRSAVIGKASRLGVEAPSKVASDTAAKINRAKPKPPARFLSARERTLPDAVATRRVIDLMRADQREAMPKPGKTDPDAIAAAPCCLTDLAHSSCRWPLNAKAADGRALFCNNDKLKTGSYCEGHARRAYTRVISKEQRDAERQALARHRDEARAAGLTDRVFGFGMAKRFA